MSDHDLHQNSGGDAFKLNGEDAAALDALLEHGLNIDDPELASTRVGRLLALLGTPVAGEDQALADVTVVRALRAGEAVLTAQDAEALDAWVMHGYDAGRVPGKLRERAKKLEALAQAASTGEVGGDRADLVERTLGRVQETIDAEGERMRVRPSVWSRFRLADVVSVAAMLLIGASVVMPAMSAVRSQQQQSACAGNMLATAGAMGLYAGSNQESLPMATAGFGGRWIDVGTPGRSNSANLYTLVRTGHEQLDQLACPGNPNAKRGEADPGARDWSSLPEVSYSYQIMAGWRPAWENGADGRRVVVLADRSPVIMRAVAHRLIDPLGGSPNHGERAQHVLFNDGSTEWTSTPELENGDNIWLPRAIERVLDQLRTGERRIEGRELPAQHDVFLGP